MAEWTPTEGWQDDPLAYLDAARDRLLETKSSPTKDAVSQWYTDTHAVANMDAEIFTQWANQNPEFGVKYHGLSALPGYNTGEEKDYHAQEAQRLSYVEATNLEYGADMKEDGKMVAWNYDDWNDLNHEGGAGDFWKLGTPSALPGGLNDFLEDNPFQVAAMIGSLFIPMLAPLVATALTVSPAVAAGILSAGMSAVGGGDIKDIVTAGLTSWGLGELSAWSDAALADLPQHPQTAEAMEIIGAHSATIVESDPNMIINFANEAIAGTATAAEFVSDVNGIGVVGAYGELTGAYDDWQKGTVSGPSGTFDMPILDYPGTLETDPNAGGATTDTGPTTGTIENEDVTLPGDGVEGDLNTEGGQSDGDIWRWDGYGQLVNVATGAVSQGDFSRSDMRQGVDYNQFGEPLGESETEVDQGLLNTNVSDLPDGRTLTTGGRPTDNYGYGGDDDTEGLGGQDGTTDTGSGDLNGGGVTDTGGGDDIEDDGFKMPPIPIPITVEDRENFNSFVPPQNMETRYQKPTYDPVEQRPLLEVEPRGLRPPMITPADNSGQPSYEEWLQDYLAQPGTQEGLLPMIAGKRTNGGLL